MSEVRVQSEGILRYVQASGSGRTWATAAGPASGRVGLVRSFQFTSAETINTVMERGIPDHHKLTSKQPIEVTFSLAWTGSGIPIASGLGASVPMNHYEFMAQRPEDGLGPTGFYHQFHGGVITNVQFTEGDEDLINLTIRALGMSGPTGSGFLTI